MIRSSKEINEYNNSINNYVIEWFEMFSYSKYKEIVRDYWQFFKSLTGDNIAKFVFAYLNKDIRLSQCIIKKIYNMELTDVYIELFCKVLKYIYKIYTINKIIITDTVPIIVYNNNNLFMLSEKYRKCLLQLSNEFLSVKNSDKIREDIRIYLTKVTYSLVCNIKYSRINNVTNTEIEWYNKMLSSINNIPINEYIYRIINIVIQNWDIDNIDLNYDYN